jgi:hypothetical protein
MIRACVSSILGFVLLVVESFIVMAIKGTDTIEFGEIAPFINAWAMNFFFVFTILTHFHLWYVRNNKKFLGEIDE